MKGKWKRFFQNHFEQISNAAEEGTATPNQEEKTWDIPIIGQSREDALKSIDLEKIRENIPEADIPQLSEVEDDDYDESEIPEIPDDIVERSPGRL
ncbi:hypothetical protein ACFFJX_06945 [Pseudarcicella hirudinis]|uniref:hypothetical protein n=1 Tax=Pseudarcicella hirudinis TaxID=1079859 RepID=UPI0035EC9A6E